MYLINIVADCLKRMAYQINSEQKQNSSTKLEAFNLFFEQSMKAKALENQKENRSNTIVKVENDDLILQLLPGMGGKIVQITDKQTGANFLKSSENDLRKVVQPKKNQPFYPPYTFGFDECFPTVSPCQIQVEGKLLNVPDHGELWRQSWNFDHDKNHISMWAFGDRLNYCFRKHIQLKGSSVSIEYELENLEPFAFDYLWSSHPLLNVQEGDELLLPEEISNVVLNWSSDSELGSFGDRLEWPYLADDNQLNFSFVQSENEKVAVKLFSDQLRVGKAGLYRKKFDRSLALSFDVKQIPYLGIWLCYGGWPDSEHPRQYTVGLEPCSARSDSLAKAIAAGEQKTIKVAETQKWQLEISISDGK